MSTTHLSSSPRITRRSRQAGQPVERSLFPLALTPFELYMLLDDGPSHPMQFCCRLRCQGEIRPEPLQVAVDQAFARHPLLTASVQPAGRKQFAWVARRPQPIQWLTPGHEGQMVEPAWIDIRHDSGVQIACQVSEHRSDLRFTFHHAACDGLAAMDFIVDVLVGYANATLGEDRFGWKPLDARMLHLRGRSGVSSWQWRLWCLRNAWRLPAAYQFYKRRPQPLFPHTLDRATPLTAASVRLHQFGVVESRQLRQSAQRAGTTVNTLLLRDLLLAFQQLRRDRSVANADDWMRVTIPLNMRSPADRQMPAANMVSLGFVDLSSADLRDRHQLLRGIDASLQRMIQGHGGLGFLTGLSVMQRYPDTLTASLHRNRCFSSVLFSNFGAALPGCCLPRSAGRLLAGNLLVEDIEFVPLLRPLQLANFAVTHYAGRYALGMRYDSRHLSASDADVALSGYVSKIRESIGESGWFSRNPQEIA